MNFKMEEISLRFGDDFLKAVADFCKSVTVSMETFIKTVVEIGNRIDKALCHKDNYAATAIVDIISRDEEIREMTKNLITLYGIDGMEILFERFFPKRIYSDNVFVIVNTYEDGCYITPSLVKSKPYVGYSDPKHRLPCNPIRGFKKQNKWNRTRSNPKLR